MPSAVVAGVSRRPARPARPARPVGDRAVLLECASSAEAAGVAQAVREASPDGLVDVVPAARTVLVRADHELHAPEVDHWRALPAADLDAVGAEMTVPVHYDGPDLADIAATLGWSTEALVDRHTSTRWRVGFCGYAPGFGYLEPDGEWPTVPRRAEPRTRVPAGSVALAAGWSAVYPRAAPGGWQLIGTTSLAVFDPDRDPAALFAPGVRVRFRAV